MSAIRRWFSILLKDNLRMRKRIGLKALSICNEIIKFKSKLNSSKIGQHVPEISFILCGKILWKLDIQTELWLSTYIFSIVSKLSSISIIQTFVYLFHKSNESWIPSWKLTSTIANSTYFWPWLRLFSKPKELYCVAIFCDCLLLRTHRQKTDDLTSNFNFDRLKCTTQPNFGRKMKLSTSKKSWWR